MLNYIWAGLIVLSLVFAMTGDLSDIQQDRYRNKVPLPVTLQNAGNFSAGEFTANVVVDADTYRTFYSVDAAPAPSYPGTITKTDHGYSIRFAKDTPLPEPWSTMRESMTDDPTETGELRGTLTNVQLQPDSSIATAQVVLEPVRFHKLRKITQAAIATSQKAVTLAISLIGGLALWLGMLRIAEKSGLIDVFVKIVRPVLHPLFPEVPRDHPALGMIALNLSAGMLGLGNAGTPMGLKAMEELQTLNPSKDTATNPMVMLLALNTTCPQLIPSPTLLAILGLGAADVWLPTLVATACAMAVAIVVTKILGRLGKYRSTDPNRANA